MLDAASAEGYPWDAAVHLAGEANLRIGEIRALIWERDVDLVAGRITVNEQTRKGVTGSPKGGKRRKIPMTDRLCTLLRRLAVIRRGFVVRNEGGKPLRDGQTTHAIYRVCREAGLPERGWHCLRHTYGTHAALFGVSPWRLQAWMGHRSINTTMGYVHVAEDHVKTLPDEVLAAARGEPDPDKRIIKMLGARGSVRPQHEVFTEQTFDDKAAH